MKETSRKKQLSDLRPRMKNLGFSISGWCRRNGYNRQTVELALRGKRNGKLSREIRAKIENLKG